LTLSAIVPASAQALAVNGVPRDIQLTGTGFAADAQVFWQVGGVNTALQVLSRTGSTQIVARIPASLLTAPLAAQVFVRNPAIAGVAAVDSNTRQFVVFVSLTLTSVQPPTAIAGSGDIVVSVFGTGFTSATRIRFASSTSGSFTPPNQVVNLSQGRIDVTVSASALAQPATYGVVAFEGAVFSNELAFQVLQSVTISSISPNSRVAGSGQFQMTIVGTGFAQGAQVLFGEQTVLTPSSFTATQLVVNATAPTSPGSLNVRVRVGDVTSNSVPFTASSPAPVLTSLDPAQRIVNSGDFELRIVGQNLAPNPTVTFDSQAVSATSTTATEVRVQISNAQLQTARSVPVQVTVGNQASNLLTFSVTVGLQLTQISPTFGQAGTAVNITAFGTGFSSNSILVLRRSQIDTALTTVVVSATELRATIPAALMSEPGTAGIFAQNGTSCDGPCPRSGSRTFSIVDNLRLNLLAPDGAPVREAGGEAVEIRLSGSGFAEDAQVLWQMGSRITQLEVLEQSATEMRAQVPAGLLTATGTATIRVRNPATTEVPQRDSNSISFEIIPRLTLTRIQPASVPAGSPATRVSVFGSGFTQATRIRLSNASGTFTPLDQSVNAGQGRIDATVGEELLRQATSYQVAAFEGGVTSNEVEFRVTRGVTISLVNPTSRPAGSGQFQLTINGSGFTQGAVVLFGDTQLTPSSITATQVVATATAPEAPGTVNVRVRFGEVESNSVPFTVTGPAPVLTTLDPSQRTANSGSFELRINGQNLSPNPTVTFDGQSVPVSSSSATEIRVQIGNSLIETPRTVLVQVRVGTQDSNILNFTIVSGAPAIQSLSPSSRAARSGDFELTINGQNLVPNPAVRFGGEPVAILGTPTATSIRVQVPDARIQQPGPVMVAVQVGSLSAETTFAITAPLVPPPAVTVTNATVQPGSNTTTRVTLAGPAPVEITGTLGLTFTPDAVAFDGFVDPALVFVANGTRTLAFTIPAGQTEAQIPEGGRVNVGTVAGTVFVRISSLMALGQSVPPPQEAREIVIPRSGPVLTAGSVRLLNTPGGVTVEVSGYAPSRQITQATFAFTIAGGTDVVGSTSFTVPLQAPFATWYSSQPGRENGSRFLLRIPFTVEEGDANRITGVTVTITSPEGQSSLTGTR
jgi:hypothetical protein